LCYCVSVSASGSPRWLLLIHQIPPKPSYLRVKVGRRLQALGAVPVKNSVYVLPRSDAAFEDLQWVRRELVAEGGDASVCAAQFVEGLSDAAIEGLFNAAREADYAVLAQEARRLQGAVSRTRKPAAGKGDRAAPLARLRKRLAEVVALDFFASPGRDAVEGLLAAIEAALRPTSEGKEGRTTAAGDFKRRTWVTRRGVHVDRMASAWLIRRFIDAEARFKFVPGQEYAPARGELRFDMFEAEFTHEGERCTFEVLMERFGLKEAALRPIAEIVHDIDLKDARFGRAEAAGIDPLIAGIAMRHKDDEARLREGGAVFESLYEYFKRKR
jgi:hypothetical protein